MSSRLFILFLFFSKIIFSQGSGNTLVFDGNDDYVNIGNQVANNCRTIEVWFKPAINITTSLPNPSCLVVRDFDNGNGASTDEFGLAFHPSGWGSNAGRLVFVRRIGSTSYDIASDQNNWQANHWYHVSVTIDAASGMKMYINGVLQQNTNPSTAPIGTQTGSSTDDVSIGRWGSLNQNRYFEGEIDEVRLWDVSRTQQEIRDNMCSSLSGNEPGLRAYWNFDSGSGNTLIDNSQNTYDGTLNNMTNSNWVYSGAPIGDTSTHTYSSNLSTTTTILNTGVGDELTVDNINSNADGVHIYKVYTLPNDTAGIGSPLDNYYGVFLTDISGTFDVSYDYNWNGCTNCDQIHSRNDNADTSWQLLTMPPSNCEFNLSNQSTVGYDYRAEYIIDTSPLLTLNNFLGSDTTICSGDSFDLNVSFPGATYLWQDNSTDSVFTVTQGGTYWVEIILNGCTVSDTINVSETMIDASLGNDTTICTGSSFDLNAFNQGATYLWQDNSTDSVFTVSQGGTYWLEVSKNGCVDSDTIEVTEINPEPNFPDDTSFCLGDSITLNAAYPGATYLWQNGSTDSVFTVHQSGTYWVEVTAGNCVASDTIDVTEINLNLNLGNDTSICFGDSLILNASNQGATYLWQDNTTDSIFTVTQGGTYWVEVSNNGCVNRDTIDVTVLDSQPNFPNDTSFCQGDSITLNAAYPGATYLWQNGSTDSVFTVHQSGTYWVEVTAGNCVASDTVDATEVTLNPDLGNDTTICPDDSIVLNAQHTGANYIWNDNSTDSVLTINQSGIYWVSVSLGGCSQSDTISVSEYNFNPFLGNDTTICPDSSLLLETQYPNAGHLWQNNSTDSTFLVNQSGTYWVEVTGNNCVSSDTINVDVFDFDSFLGNDTTLCSDSSILLNAPFENAFFNWQDSSNDSTYLADQGGTYWIEVQVNNCLALDTVEIEEIDFSISLGNDTTICADSSLDLTTGYPNLIHIWQDSSTDTSFSVSQSGIYWVEVDSLGCKESDTIQVQEFNLNPFINNDTTICVDSSLTFTLQYPYSTYLWQDNSTDSVYTVSQPGIYWVEIQGAVCSSTDTIVVDQLSVNPNLGSDTSFCQGSGIYLNPLYPNGSYLWQDNSIGSTYFVSEPGIYWVQVEDRGCVGVDTVEVDTINCDTLLSEPEVILELPNVITPNNDMINDVFTPKEIRGIRSMNTVIYNRWGEKMFESDFTTIMWNAYKASDGTYFWIIEYTDVNGNSVTKEGDLMILR